MTGSVIDTLVSSGVALGSVSYASPLTITSTGTIQPGTAFGTPGYGIVAAPGLLSGSISDAGLVSGPGGGGGITGTNGAAGTISVAPGDVGGTGGAGVEGGPGIDLLASGIVLTISAEGRVFGGMGGTGGIGGTGGYSALGSGGTGGTGGAGGAGGDGVDVAGDGSTIENAGTLMGGEGGTAGLGGAGGNSGAPGPVHSFFVGHVGTPGASGNGGAGIALYAPQAAILNTGFVAGGTGKNGADGQPSTHSSTSTLGSSNGGAGYAGGNGGAGILAAPLAGTLSTISNAGTILGGAGAAAGNGGRGANTYYGGGGGGYGGTGGTAGIGLVLQNANVINTGLITGGAGGAGGNGGAGGDAYRTTGAGTGGSGGAGGAGGTGVTLQLATLTNEGIITGGGGGLGGVGGRGGHDTSGHYASNGTSGAAGQGGIGAVIGSGGVLDNFGTITAGYAGAGSGTSGIAVAIAGGGTLVAEAGAVFTGTVVALGSTQSVLELAGTSSAGFTGLEHQFTGFTGLTFASGAARVVEFGATESAAGLAFNGFAQGDAIVLDGITEISASFGASGLVLNGYDTITPAITLNGSTTLDIAGSFSTSDFAFATGAGNTTISLNAAPCFWPGTRIATPRGETAVELLAIGDMVHTEYGAAPVKWIGRRSYDGRFIAGNHLILPVTIKAGALAQGQPVRDLILSPGHAVFIDGALIPAWRLVNGVTITQAEAVARADYLHVELEGHDIIFAEGCAVESYLAGEDRAQFQNGAEFLRLYPDAAPALPLLPRCEDGFALDATRRRLAARAGLALPEGTGAVRGFVDIAGPTHCAGWAQYSDAPEAPVALDIFAAGIRIARVLANGYRADLRTAGLGSGCHAFNTALPATHATLEVRVAACGTPLALTEAARAA